MGMKLESMIDQCITNQSNTNTNSNTIQDIPIRRPSMKRLSSFTLNSSSQSMSRPVISRIHSSKLQTNLKIIRKFSAPRLSNAYEDNCLIKDVQPNTSISDVINVENTRDFQDEDDEDDEVLMNGDSDNND